jgi:hypothetical protein
MPASTKLKAPTATAAQRLARASLESLGFLPEERTDATIWRGTYDGIGVEITQYHHGEYVIRVENFGGRLQTRGSTRELLPALALAYFHTGVLYARREMAP